MRYIKTSLKDGKTHEWLDFLSNQIGGRLSGSLNAERAVNWAESELIKLGLDEVLQPVMVPKWVREIQNLLMLKQNLEKP